MKLSKEQGIQTLKYLKMPTIEKIKLEDIENNREILEQGLSVRTSPKSNSNKENNVNLPSIHNCKNLEQIKKFIEQNKGMYNIFIHKTVKPEVIGSVSRYGNESERKLSIEIFKDFKERAEEKVENGIAFDIEGGRPTFHNLTMYNTQRKEDYVKFSKVLKYIYNWPFDIYDAEFVIEDGNVIFTDLTIQDTKEQNEIKRCIYDEIEDER